MLDSGFDRYVDIDFHNVVYLFYFQGRKSMDMEHSGVL